MLNCFGRVETAQITEKNDKQVGVISIICRERVLEHTVEEMGKIWLTLSPSNLPDHAVTYALMVWS